MTRERDPARCFKWVDDPASMGYHSHQCHNKIWKDELCKLHHPETVAIREEALDKKRKEKNDRSIWGHYNRACDKIGELEAEVVSLKIQLAEKDDLLQKHIAATGASLPIMIFTP